MYGLVLELTRILYHLIVIRCGQKFGEAVEALLAILGLAGQGEEELLGGTLWHQAQFWQLLLEYQVQEMDTQLLHLMVAHLMFLFLLEFFFKLQVDWERLLEISLEVVGLEVQLTNKGDLELILIL
jgi:hypothetical protein